ncbi:MAG: UPF0147 family protein [archaeon]
MQKTNHAKNEPCELIDVDNPIAETVHEQGGGFELGEYAGTVSDLLDFLSNVLSDPALPRNVKVAITDVKAMITDQSEPDLNVRKNHALSRVEEIVEDPNIPLHGRTVLWDVLGRIESI